MATTVTVESDADKNFGKLIFQADGSEMALVVPFWGSTIPIDAVSAIVQYVRDSGTPIQPVQNVNRGDGTAERGT